MEFGASTYYILSEVIACALSFLLIINILLTFSFYDKRQRLFLYATISTLLASFFNVVAVFCITNYRTWSLGFCTLISTLYFMFLMMSPLCMAMYAVDIASAFPKTKKVGFSICGIVYAMYLLTILLNVRLGWIFRYDIEDGYIKGSLKNVTYLATAFYSLFIMLTVFINRKLIARRIFYLFIAYPFVSLFFVAFQFLFPNVIMTGTASFAAVFFAYLVVQSYLIELDLSTGLMTESKLRKRVQMHKTHAVLYVFAIDNMNLIQSSMELSDWNLMMLNIGEVFSRNFPASSYHISTDRFAAIGKNLEEVQEKSEIIKKEVSALGEGLNSFIPIPIVFYMAAVEFSETENDYDSLMDIINNILTKSKEENFRALQVCDEAILVERERKRYIYRILKRELSIESSQFQVWFQPIYSLKEKKIHLYGSTFTSSGNRNGRYFSGGICLCCRKPRSD